MKSNYSIGIIGAGMYGKVFMRALQTDPRARLSWVCSATEATTRGAAKEFGVPLATLNYQDILADPGVDAVMIATPPYLHAQLVVDALAAGKHVLVEKPLAVSREGVAQIVAAVQAAPGKVVLEASCRHARLQPKFEFAHDFIKSGKLGQIYHIHHRFLSRRTFIEWNKKGAWAMDRKLAGGGPLMDMGVYDLSFHLGLLDDVPQLKSLRSFTVSGLRDISHLVPFNDVEQHAAAWMEFDTGLTYYYECGGGVHGETANETGIYGTKGGLHLQYPRWNSCSMEYFYADELPRKETFEVDMSKSPDDDAALARHFLDCLDGKAQPMMPMSRAAKHIEILFKILSGENYGPASAA
jgi:predicted dehydrogenase